MSEGGRLSATDVATRAEVTAGDIRRWVIAGLLTEHDDGFDDDAVDRADLLAFATSRGIREDAIAAACQRDPGLIDRFVAIITGARGATRSIEDAAAEAGLDIAFVRRMRAVSGLAAERADDDDVAALRAASTALAVGFPEEALLQLVRVFADALGRVADAEVRLFHFYFHDRLHAGGMPEDVIGKATDEAATALLGLLDPTVAYFHRKAWESALREDMLGHFAEVVAPAGGAAGRIAVAVLFVDLTGYTALTERIGDVAAAEVVDRFSVLVREEALGAEGRVVKQIGDEFMLAFPSADAAVAYALRLARRAAAQADVPPLRMGIHYGDALYREADYLGATVNVAARVTAQARSGELVVTPAVRDALRSVDVATSSLGEHRLKGVAAPLELLLVDVGGTVTA